MWGPRRRIGHRGLENQFEISLLPFRWCRPQSFFKDLPSRNKLARRLRPAACQPGSNHRELASLGIEQARHNRVIFSEPLRIVEVRAPDPAIGSLLTKDALPVVLHEREMQSRYHLHRPLVVKGSDDDVRRVPQVFEGVVRADAHLAWLA